MTCRDAIALLADYLESALTADVAEQLEAHLRDCPPCIAYLNTYRRTREVAAEVSRVEMPAEMKARLRAFLFERLRDRRG
jgi:anti-sigma factor RsiW